MDDAQSESSYNTSVHHNPLWKWAANILICHTCLMLPVCWWFCDYLSTKWKNHFINLILFWMNVILKGQYGTRRCSMETLYYPTLSLNIKTFGILMRALIFCLCTPIQSLYFYIRTTTQIKNSSLTNWRIWHDSCKHFFNLCLLLSSKGEAVKKEDIFVAVKTCRKFHSERGTSTPTLDTVCRVSYTGFSLSGKCFYSVIFC